MVSKNISFPTLNSLQNIDCIPKLIQLDSSIHVMQWVICFTERQLTLHHFIYRITVWFKLVHPSGRSRTSILPNEYCLKWAPWLTIASMIDHHCHVYRDGTTSISRATNNPSVDSRWRCKQLSYFE